MGEFHLIDLLTFTRDGEWGKGEPDDGFVPMQIIRGTDFERVRYGDLTTLPIRYIRSDIAERKALKANDILIETAGGTKDQSTGRTVLITEKIIQAARLPLTCASFARFLRPNPKKIHPAFLFWKLQSEYTAGRLFPFHVQHTGVARFQYTQFAQSHSLTVPDKPKQRDIASILSALDDKIKLNRRTNESLGAMARAIFRDWFVDFGPTRTKMRDGDPYLAPDIWALFPGTLNADGIPEGWEISTIGEEVDAVGGSTPSTKEPTFWDGSIHWATPKDLSSLNSPVLLQTGRTISEGGLAKISSGLLPKGTVLLSSRAPIGYVAIAEIPVAVNQGFIAMRCEKRLSNLFVWMWTLENLETVTQNANGSTFQEISKRNFRPIPATVPSARVRAAFDEIASPLYERIAANERESRALTETRDLLLPRLMSGELRVQA